MNKANSFKKTNEQLIGYIHNKIFSELDEFEGAIYGITLTKTEHFTPNNMLIPITWSDIISNLASIKNQDELLKDYYKFITGIRGSMKFYEEEVYSIPTHDFSQEVVNKLRIYECPNEGKHLIKRKPLYVTFRKSNGGIMDKLYKIEDILILNFKNDLEAFLKDDTYKKDYRTRVQKYAKLRTAREGPFDDKEKQVLFLSDETIDLLHEPRPRKNNNFRGYYELSELLNSENQHVKPSSIT